MPFLIHTDSSFSGPLRRCSSTAGADLAVSEDIEGGVENGAAKPV